jgi:phage terminase small subunit
MPECADLRESAHLTPRQRRFCAALLTARSVEEAGLAVGVHRRQASTYLASPAVRLELARLLDDTTAQAVRQAVAGMAGALATLEEIHAGADTPASARVAAARAILECGMKLRVELEIVRRIAALEELWHGTDTTG